MRRTRMLALACGLAGTATLAAAVAAPAAFAADKLTGSAFAVSLNAKALNAVAVNVDPLPKATYPAGADKSVVKIDVPTNLPGHAKLLNAASDVKDGVLTSAASIADVDLLGLVKAKLITATCTSDGKTTTGESKLADVWVHGQKIDVALSGKISVTDAITVYINEKVAKDGVLTVNALRVSVGEGDIAGINVGGFAKVDLILSQVKCAGPGKIVDEPGNPGTTTTPQPTTSNPTTSPGGSVTPAPTTSSSSVWPPASTTTSASAPAGHGGITPAGNAEDLAQTGVSAIVPLSIGGLVLLAGGAGAVVYTRRKRGAAVEG